MKILVIDDDEVLARALKRLLRDHDVAVETDARRGLVRVLGAGATEGAFDAVLCDYLMPVLTGLDVLAGFRGMVDAPIFVLMTGYDNVIDGADGADGVLTKPFKRADIDDLIARIKMIRSNKLTKPDPRVPSAPRRLAS